MLQFKDPTKLRTKKIVFEAVFGAEDSGTLEQLKELSSKRLNIESMNKNKSVPGPNAECEQDIQKLELYLPSLDNLVQHVDFLGYNDPRVIRLISNLKIRWTSPLSSTCSLNIMGPKFFQVDSLRFELGLVLFFYGSLLRERASQVLDTGRILINFFFQSYPNYFYNFYGMTQFSHRSNQFDRPDQWTGKETGLRVSGAPSGEWPR
ncbi:putative BRO1 domain superfamily protein [Helianthus annuus]|nr:putative BRO1 domain superfamily protein [Helianthus annuus]